MAKTRSVGEDTERKRGKLSFLLRPAVFQSSVQREREIIYQSFLSGAQRDF